MRLITFQPLHVLDTINKQGVYKAPFNSQTGSNKIYCLQVNENTMERIFTCAPSMPQVGIIFETDDYEELDSIAWVNELFLNIKTNKTSKYKEYTVGSIKQSQIIKTIDISDSDNPDEVQDKFMDKHFKEFEKLSGHKWYRVCDREDIIGTDDAKIFFEYIQLCMMPYREVTEEDYDKWLDIIRKLYIKKEF